MSSQRVLKKGGVDWSTFRLFKQISWEQANKSFVCVKTQKEFVCESYFC